MISRLELRVVLPLIAILASCGWTLPKELAPLARIEECPPATAGDLARAAQSYDRATPILTLECTLALFRREQPEDAAATMAAAKVCYLLADCSTHPTRMVLLGAEGVRWAERSVRHGGGNDGRVHYYLAVDLGVAVRELVVAAVRNLARLESELKKAREMAPDEDGGGPIRVLGMLYLRAPAWPQGVGDIEKAKQFLKEAVQRYPDHPLNHLFYVRALWEDDGQDAAKEIASELQKASDLVRKGGWGCTENHWREEILQLANEAGVTLSP